MERLHLVDTTLRDGALTRGVSFSPDQKRELAASLDEARVDIVEVGFPSPGHTDGIEGIARPRFGRVAAIARAEAAHVDAALDALRGVAPTIRLHLFAGPKQRANVTAAVERAVARDAEVAFSPLNAAALSREDLDALIRAAIDAGASVINLSDTVGMALPEDIRALFEGVRERIPAARDVRLSFHGHDDLGLATANSLAAIRAGARQIEGCLLGLGPRAGNTALEELVAIVERHGERLGVEVATSTAALGPVAARVAALTGVAHRRRRTPAGGAEAQVVDLEALATPPKA